MNRVRHHEAVVSLGSNVAEAEAMLREAIARLRLIGSEIVVSQFTTRRI